MSLSLATWSCGLAAPSLRAGFGVVAEAWASTSEPLPAALRTLWPDKFRSPSAAKKAIRRQLVLVGENAPRPVTTKTTDDVTKGTRVRLLARVAPGPAAGEGRRGWRGGGGRGRAVGTGGRGTRLQ